MGESDPIKLQRGDGAVLARFKAGPAAEGGARLDDLYQASPGRALQPRPEPGEAVCMVLLTTSGGLTGGDRLRLDITAETGASVMVMAQAAEKVYRSASNDADTRLMQRLEVQPGAKVEWLPQETILFDGARLHRSFDIHLEHQAWALVGDITMFGRVARGESFAQGRLFDQWQVFQDGRLVWTDRLGLEGDIPALLGHPAGFAGARAQGSILCAGLSEAAQAEALEALRETVGGLVNVRFGATRIGGLLLLRLLGPDPAALRQAFGQAWSYLRGRAGWAATMPRLWLR